MAPGFVPILNDRYFSVDPVLLSSIPNNFTPSSVQSRVVDTCLWFRVKFKVCFMRSGRVGSIFKRSIYQRAGAVMATG